jgi:hypothetical protein
LWEKLMVKWQLVCGYWPKPWHLVNPKIAGKWMFIPLELIIIGFDPPPCDTIPLAVQSELFVMTMIIIIIIMSTKYCIHFYVAPVFPRSIYII